MTRFVFPPWVNRFVPLLGAVLAIAVLYLVALGMFFTAPSTINVGYSPEQPLPFNHQVHAGVWKLDCRYCHNTVDRSSFAAIPPTQTCLNCHSGADANGVTASVAVHATSPKLLLVRQSQATGRPILWEKIHDLPDYVYFDHSAHVTRGIGCVSCHGRIDTMQQVYQVHTLSMAWCLECHRNPEPHLRPLEAITDMSWVPEKDQLLLGAELRAQWNIRPSTNCSTCHR